MSEAASIVSGTDFVALPTRDWEASKKFYTEVMGLECTFQWGEMPAGEFETGNLTLAVMQSDAFGFEFQAHSAPVAFRVDDYDAARTELESRGITLSDTIDSGVCKQAYFKDPDGNAIGIHSRYVPRDDG